MSHFSKQQLELTANQIQEMLDAIPADCNYETWTSLTTAVKTALNEDGKDIALRWSATGKDFKAREFDSKWGGLQIGSVGIGYLISVAKSHGWQPTRSQSFPVSTTPRSPAPTPAPATPSKYAEPLLAASRTGQHPYLSAKNLSATPTLKLIASADAAKILSTIPAGAGGTLLIVPFRDGEGGKWSASKLWTAQVITAEGQKQMLPGAGSQGDSYWQPADVENPTTIFIGEGMADALAAFQAFPDALCAAAGSAGRLKRIAKVLRKRYQSAAITILADRDKGEPCRRAIEAAQAVGGFWCAPPADAKAKDWADYWLAADANAEAMATAMRACSVQSAQEKQAEPATTPTPTPLLPPANAKVVRLAASAKAKKPAIDSENEETGANEDAVALEVGNYCFARTVKEMGETLRCSNFYRFLGGIGEVLREGEIFQHNVNSIRYELARRMRFFCTNNNHKTFLVPPPLEEIKSLCAGKLDMLNPLAGVARQPFLRSNGTVIKKRGYDAGSRMFCAFNPADFKLPENPTRDDAEAALKVLSGPLQECAFADEIDRATAIAALITAAARPSLDHAPGFLVSANSPGAGKSYLCSIIAGLAQPNPAASIVFKAKVEEQDKQLLGILSSAPSVVLFDDIQSDIYPSSMLNSAIANGFVSGRILGQTKMVEAECKALFLFNGNNVDLVRDIARRVVTIKLEHKTEAPDRRFSADISEIVRSNRAEYISAALTIIRAFLAHGGDVKGRPVMGFYQWCRWCRDSLMWLGLPDISQRLFEGIEKDPDGAAATTIFSHWFSAWGDAEKLVSEVLEYAMGFPRGTEDEVREFLDFRSAIEEVCAVNGRLNAQRLGHWLKKQQNRKRRGYILRRSDSKTAAARWRVVFDPF